MSTTVSARDEVVTKALLRLVNVPGLDGQAALITLDNGFDYKKPNSFGPAGLASLSEAIDAALGDGTRALVVDLSRTTFVDSTGLSHLLRARRRADAERATLRIVAPPGSEARVVIDLTGVGSLLGVDDPPPQ